MKNPFHMVIFLSLNIILTALLCLSGCSINSSQGLFSPSPTSTRTCFWGNFKTIEMPEQSLNWQKKLEDAGIPATDIHFMAFGETVRCGRDDQWEDEEMIPQYVELEMTILVMDLEHEDDLFDYVADTMETVELYRGESPVQTILLTFTTDESEQRVLEFNVEQAKQLQSAEMTPADFLATLEKR